MVKLPHHRKLRRDRTISKRKEPNALFRKDLTPERVEAVIANLDAGLVAQLERFIGKPDDQLRINLLRAMTRRSFAPSPRSSLSP